MNTLTSDIPRLQPVPDASPQGREGEPASRQRFVAISIYLAFGLLLALMPNLYGQQPAFVDREPEIKAAYIYNFGRYVEWPPQAIGPREFVIGVVGDSPVAAPLSTIARSKKIGSRTIVMRRFKDEKDITDCQLLYIPAGQNPKLVEATLKNAKNSATLIVGEEQEFVIQHGHVGFHIVENNVKFAINHKAATRAGLKISSKLLSLGTIVGEPEGK